MWLLADDEREEDERECVIVKPTPDEISGTDDLLEGELEDSFVYVSWTQRKFLILRIHG